VTSRPSPAEAEEAAVSLAMAVSRLRLRLREETGTRQAGLSLSQLAVLKRIIEGGPTTAAALASAEHVSQQAIAQSLAALKSGGLVQAGPDPTDGRKSLLTATAAGRRRRDSLFASHTAWLTRAIEATVPPADRDDLGRAIALLERLADAELTGEARSGPPPAVSS
jgi:DNA-binding MarR family transcriptional regulator